MGEFVRFIFLIGMSTLFVYLTKVRGKSKNNTQQKIETTT